MGKAIRKELWHGILKLELSNCCGAFLRTSLAIDRSLCAPRRVLTVPVTMAMAPRLQLAAALLAVLQASGSLCQCAAASPLSPAARSAAAAAGMRSAPAARRQLAHGDERTYAAASLAAGCAQYKRVPEDVSRYGLR